MNFEKLKNNKAVQVALIIALPTALVLAYYGYKYVKKKNLLGLNNKNIEPIEEESKEPIINKNNVEYYRLRLPYLTDISNITKKYLLSKGLPFNTVSVKTAMNENSQHVIDYYIMIEPKDAVNLVSLVSMLGKDYIITKANIEDTVVKPIENPVCIKERDEINSFEEFFESIGCLDYTNLWGYTLTDIKNIPNVNDKISLDELRRIYNLVYSGNFNVPEQERIEILNILKKIYENE